ncbi:uncharacterized protein LOC143589350 [Bidens hawaiensis]|uniref:uncharacterized protein LOC143589350 n=1 Tax=Bidens hawaiensis TaxID=980011 RepID=UPI00404ADCFA
MSNSENSFESSDSSSLSECNEWEEQAFQVDLQFKLNVIMCELLINMSNTSRRYCDRKREQGEARLIEDYFVENPTYEQATFRRRFHMRKPFFLRIVEAITTNDMYFQQIRDATSRQCLSPFQKCTRAIHVLAYDTLADVHDEYLRMSATTTRAALIKFVEGVI